MKLDESFYLSSNVVKAARDLLGKHIYTKIDGAITAGMIVETEAYSYKEKASHAFNGMTPRNKVMFEPGGFSYVYLCYGIHHLFNVVTNEKDVAEAVLVRALEPVAGLNHMLRRMGTDSARRITAGPGKLTKALGIDRSFNGKHLRDDEIWIEEGIKINRGRIVSSERIGVDYAGEDAKLPWRFSIKGNDWVSR